MSPIIKNLLYCCPYRPAMRLIDS